MTFGQEMRGKSSNEAIVHIQDAELRLLDTVHHFISMHIDNDKKYATGLSKMLTFALKCDISEFKECCNIFKAWDVILQETDKLMKMIKTNAEHLQTSTLEALSQLISEKKQAKKAYLDSRNRLDLEFTKVQDEMTKNRTEYSKSVERLTVDKAKFLDCKSKGKPGPKVDDAKSKFFRSTVHLHKLHNDYIISVNNAQEHQTLLRETTLPGMLNSHHEEQEAFVFKTKYIMEDYLLTTNTCGADFQAARQNMLKAADKIEPGLEYTGSFLDQFKSSLPPPISLEFDENLLNGYSGSLKANKIEVNDLTLELLQERVSKLNQEVDTTKEKLSNAASEESTKFKEMNNVYGSLTDSPNLENINTYITKKCEHEEQLLEKIELESSLKKLEKLVTLVLQPLDLLGSNPAPPASDIHDIVEGDSSDSTSLSGGTPQEPMNTTLMKLAKMNPFKKNAKDSTVAGVENNNTDTAPAVKKKLQGYEKHEPLLATNNSKVSMSKLKEQGRSVDMNASEAKSRIADEQWFHGILPREEVQRLLVNDGDFLVRESKSKKTSEAQFVLSVFWQNHRHFIIQFDPDKGWHFEGDSYPTIQELVRKQYESGTAVTSKSGVILKTPILREWELLNDDIELTVKIGSGNFGEVYKGMYKKNQVVAVKTCKDTLSEEQKIKFLQEGRILKQYNHPNIVKFIGIAAQKQPVMIVMEFISKGALLSYLKMQGASHSAKQKVQMCVDAASGMEYLESRGCIHRDLAARNCLVGDNNIIKISDFGMSREEEVYSVTSANNQVPVKWTAPEALNFSTYTSLCDVWSFGVLMWEIFSNGKTPYPGMTNIKARMWIEEGKRMDAPPGTPNGVYTLMMKCWEYESKNRPHFMTIHDTLTDIVKTL